jgi:hypothetical protein
LDAAIQPPTAPTSIVVTKTFGDARAVKEVENFVKMRKILGIKRNEGQCVACAVALAHAVGGVIVVA